VTPGNILGKPSAGELGIARIRLFSWRNSFCIAQMKPVLSSGSAAAKGMLGACCGWMGNPTFLSQAAGQLNLARPPLDSSEAALDYEPVVPVPTPAVRISKTSRGGLGSIGARPSRREPSRSPG